MKKLKQQIEALESAKKARRMVLNQEKFRQLFLFGTKFSATLADDDPQYAALRDAADTLRAKGDTQHRGISMDALRQANRDRQAEWPGNDRIDTAFRALEVAGEAGELCEAVKKFIRGQRGIAGSTATLDDIATETARADAAEAESAKLREALHRITTEAELEGLGEKAGWDCWIANARAALSLTAPDQEDQS